MNQTFFNWKAIILSLFLCFINSDLLAWTSPTPITSTGNNSLPATAIDATGNGIAVWLNGTFPSTKVQAATYITGTWSAPFDLTVTADAYYNPSVTVDTNGNAIVVWEKYTAGDNQIQAVRIPFNNSPESIVTLSFVGDNRRPSVILDSSGNGFAIWEDRDTDKICASRYNTLTSWAAPVTVAQTGGLFAPRITVNPAGTAIAYWFNTGSAQGKSSLFSLGSWASIGAIDTTTTPQLDSISLTIDADGNAVAVWVEDQNAQLYSASRPDAGSWGTSQVISDDNPNAYQSLGVDTSGNAVAAWVNYDLNVVEAASYISGAWQTPVIVSSGVGNQEVNVTIDALGKATVIYQSWDGGTIQEVNLPFGGVWSAPTQVSGNSGYSFSPTVKTNSAGNSIALWVNTDGTDSNIHASIN